MLLFQRARPELNEGAEGERAEGGEGKRCRIESSRMRMCRTVYEAVGCPRELVPLARMKQQGNQAASQLERSTRDWIPEDYNLVLIAQFRVEVNSRREFSQVSLLSLHLSYLFVSRTSLL